MSNLPVVAGKDLIAFDEKKLALIRNVVAKDLTQDEFELFISVAKARGLDPVLGQIHAVKRGDGQGAKRMVIQVGIDGGRLIAARTGEYAGSDRPEFERNEQGNITAAIVTVWRFVQGNRVSFTGVAYWDEFYPGEKMGFMWHKMPHSQLAKCAEMQALRKGFPNDLGGLYAPEELERDVSSEAQGERPPPALAPTDTKEDWATKVNDLLAKFRKIRVSEKMICAKYGCEAAFEISDEEYSELVQIGSDIANKRKKIEDCFPSSQQRSPA